MISLSNYIITSDGRFISEDELYHWGIKGMKWGVRRYQNPDGSLTAAGKRRQAREENRERVERSKSANKYAKQGNKIQSTKKYAEMTRQISKNDDPKARKARIDADIKEADDRVKFYGSKRAAKAAIKDEAGYAKSVNRGKAAMNTLKYGSIAAVPVAALAAIATSGLAGAAGVAAVATYGITGTIMGTGAAVANRYINNHAKDQIAYTDESEYGHDLVVTMKKH